MEEDGKPKEKGPPESGNHYCKKPDSRKCTRKQIVSETDLRNINKKLNLQNHILKKILGSSSSLLADHDLDSLLQEIVQAAHDDLGFDSVMLSLKGDTDSCLNKSACYGFKNRDCSFLEEILKKPWKEHSSILLEKFRNNHCYFIPNNKFNWQKNFDVSRSAKNYSKISARFHKHENKWQPGDVLFAVIVTQGEKISGLLSVDRPLDEKRPETATLQALEVFANLAGVAIENSFLYDCFRKELSERKKIEQKLRRANDELDLRVKERTAELAETNNALIDQMTKVTEAEQKLKVSLEEHRNAFEGMVAALSSTVETRDPYTAGHQQAVTRLACTIAKEMGLCENKIDGLRVASLLHDIGKIKIPAEILTKPGRLSPMEYELIKRHPQVGYDILKVINFPWPIAEIMFQHHERLNGMGYPKGLKNDEIMLESRILAVADVVEPMSSHRPYRPALGIDKALEEISNNSGILYDTNVVNVCMNLFKNGKYSFNSHDTPED